MRVLWLTNDPLEAFHRRQGRTNRGSGHWMSCLLAHLSAQPGVSVEVATAYPGVPDQEFEDAGTRHFILRQPRFQPFFRATKRDLERVASLVRERRPDIVHIHGTERFYGLLPARGLIAPPSLISLQGFLGPCVRDFFGTLRPIDIVRSQSLLETLTRRGLLWRRHDFAEGARNEAEVLAHAPGFLGRTEWDRAIVGAANPLARYFHVGETLRDCFSERRWKLNSIRRHSIVFTNSGMPLRGTEVLIEALSIVRRSFPAATLRLAGHFNLKHGYQRFLQRRIARAGLASHVELLGALDGESMAAELAQAHVFAIASFVENSPNSLCEAMLMGLPCVASHTGGIGSLVTHNQDGLLYPAGDAALLAASIMRVFENDDLAVRLGESAHLSAAIRHDPRLVLQQLNNAYSETLNHAAFPAEALAQTQSRCSAASG